MSQRYIQSAIVGLVRPTEAIYHRMSGRIATQETAWPPHVQCSQALISEILVMVADDTCERALLSELRDSSPDTALLFICEQLQIELRRAERVLAEIMEAGAVDFVNEIVGYVGLHTYDVWLAERVGFDVLLKYVGDWRCLQWQYEHMQDGVYYESPIATFNRNSYAAISPNARYFFSYLYGSN